MLAIFFGWKRFHQYLYRLKVKVETDHKPLVPIFKKTLSTAPPRLQRMLLELKSYDLDVAYVPGKQIPVADTLSRNFVSETYPSLTRVLDALVHSVLGTLPICDRKLLQVRWNKRKRYPTLVSNCDICLKHRYSNNKELLQLNPIPNHPWQSSNWFFLMLQQVLFYCQWLL